jgi:hypothetical protein
MSSNSDMANILRFVDSCVLYCFTWRDPISYLEDFLISFKKFEPENYQLLILIKIGRRVELMDNIRTMVEAKSLQRCKIIECKDVGFDIATFINITKSENHEIFVWITASSEITRKTWLSELTLPIQRGESFVCGSMASNESLSSGIFNRLSDSAEKRMLKVFNKGAFHSDYSFINQAVLFFRAALAVAYCLIHPIRILQYKILFPLFPNPHLRTTGIAIQKSFFETLDVKTPYRRIPTLAFESGKSSISILSNIGMKQPIVVVNNAYCSLSDPAAKETFRSKSFYVPPVIDRHFKSYLKADAKQALKQELLSWGIK